MSSSTSLMQRELPHGDTSNLQSGEELQSAPPPPSDNKLQSVPPPPNDNELQSVPPPPSDNELPSVPPPPSDNELPSAPLPPSEQLCITIHRTDVLCASVNLVHPVVRVSVVDGEGGQLLKKSRPEQCVASFYETDNPAVDYILPVMTQPCGLQEHWYGCTENTSSHLHTSLQPEHTHTHPLAYSQSDTYIHTHTHTPTSLQPE